MIWKSTVLLASLVGIVSASCSHDGCYQGIVAEATGIADCEAYLEVAYPEPTATQTVTWTASPTTVSRTVTDTSYLSAAATDVVRTTETETTTIITTPYIEAVATATTTVDATDFAYQTTTLVTVTRLSGGDKTRRVAPTTTVPSVWPTTVPAYAAECPNAAAYKCVCLCAGATVGSTTCSPSLAATTTTTVTTTVTPTVTETVHVSATDTTTGLTVTTTETATQLVGRISIAPGRTFTTFTDTTTTATVDVQTVTGGTLTETVTVTP